MSATLTHGTLRPWLLLLGGLLISPLSAADDEFRISTGVRPIEQSVWLKLDPAQDAYTGRVKITLERTEVGKNVQFSGLDYRIDSARLHGAADCELNIRMGQNGLVDGVCQEELPIGRYELDIDFHAPYNRKSVGLFKTLDQGEPYLFTQFEMSDARRAFPVFDEPEFKIPFTLSISVPDGLKAYSNAPETAQTRADGWTTREFAKTPPIPSYLVAFAVGALEEYPVKGLRVPGRIITTRGKSALAPYAAEQMPKILDALEAYFGRPYPYAKLDSVALPEFPFGAMENAGLITYREDLLLLDAAQASLEQKRASLGVIAHEIAHQWYGNLVTMRWWDDLWLNEAFASWMGSKIIGQLYPELETQLNLPQNGAMPSDALVTTRPIRKPIRSEADVFDGLGLAYSKGSAVLSMVEQWIGEDAFRRGIRAYLKAHEFGNAQADDLWGALGRAADQDVAAVLRSFIEQSSFPLLKVELDGRRLKLTQQRFTYPGVTPDPQRWTVPVNISYGDRTRSRRTSVLLSSDSMALDLEFEPQWVYPDTDGRGYYRFKLAEALRAQSLPHFTAKNLNVRERLAFIAGSNALFQAGQLDAPAYLGMVVPFIEDAHPRVVSSALNQISDLSEPLVSPSISADWSRFVAASAQPALKRYGLRSRKDDAAGMNGLRSTLIRLAGLDGRDQEVIAQCLRQARRFLEDPDRADNGLIDAQLAVAAFHGDQALYDQMVTVFESTTRPAVRSSVLQALAMFGDAKLQGAALDYLLTDRITASDVRYVLQGQLYTETRAARTRAWIYRNYDELLKKLPPFMVPIMPQVLGGGCDKGVLDAAYDYFLPRLEDTPAYSRALEKTAAAVRQCADLRARESQALARYLKELQ